ncbi:hypothetical protein ILFOPFJJ_05501 [Ensifer psoraleae]|nr:hypothetical protein [Sinorhizobium psoraleae]
MSALSVPFVIRYLGPDVRNGSKRDLLEGRTVMLEMCLGTPDGHHRPYMHGAATCA